MNLREQEYMLAIGRRGSIKKAAEDLNISAPTLSVFLSTLEKNIGVPLFNRLGKKMVPTEAGTAYLRCAQEMSYLKRQYESVLSGLKNGGRGTLRLGIHPRRTTYLLPAALREFAILYPYIQVNVHESSSANLFKLLLEGEVDLIINNQRNPDPALEYLPFYKDRLVMVLSPRHPLAGKSVTLPGQPLPWMDLSLFAGETFILQKPDQSTRIYTDRAIAYAGVRPGKAYIIENLEAASQMAAEGLGVAFNLYGFAKHFFYPRPVQYSLVGDLTASIDYYIVQRRDLYMAPHVHEFIKILRAQMAEELPFVSGTDR